MEEKGYLGLDANEEPLGMGMTEDEINQPRHYNQGDIECIDAIKAMLGQEGFIAYLRGTIAKYNWRLLHKGKPLRDAQKMAWFEARLLKELELIHPSLIVK